MKKFEYRCPICGKIYSSDQSPQHIFICDCGKVDIPLYSINLRSLYPDEVETIILHSFKHDVRYKWVTKDGRALYLDEMSETHKKNILRMLRTTR